jgi:hypothetical protein
VVISTLLDNLRGHPIWCTNEGIFLCRKGSRKLPRNTEVGELDFTSGGQQNIGGCVGDGVSTYPFSDKEADAPLISR